MLHFALIFLRGLEGESRLQSWFRVVLFAAIVVAHSGSGAWASGGVVKRKTDGGSDGYYYNVLGPAAGRYCSLYLAGELDVGAVICGMRRRDLDSSVITSGVDDYTLIPDLRTTDVNCKGYADLTAGGLLASADSNSLASCSTSAVRTTSTFGGGAGVLDPLVDFLLTLSQPANNDANNGTDFCGIQLDTSSLFVNSARSQSLCPGGSKTTIGFNHFVEAIVFEPKRFDLNVRMTGSSRFAGDRGLPIMFSRRGCDANLSVCSVDAGDAGNRTTDDYITARLTIDNNTAAAPRPLNLIIEADRAALNPKLTPKDITPLFRPIGGGPPLMNPITFPDGRTRFDLEIKIAIKRKFLSLFPIDLPFNVRLQDPNLTGDIPDTESQSLGLRPNTGFYDNDRYRGGFFFTQSPVLTGDSLNVRFDAIDGPKIDDNNSGEVNIAGAQVVAGEFGASGLSGLDAFQVRLEDSVLQGSPDLSPQGLLRSVGTLGDPGNADGIPAGLVVTTVTIDFTDISLDPLDPSLYPNLFFMAFLNPGDTLASLTAIASAGPGDTFVGNSSSTSAFANPAGGFNQDDFEIRADYDGELGTIGQRKKTNRVPGATVRRPGEFKVVTKRNH